MPGRKGLKGAPGTQGAPGFPARMPCESPVDLKKICADPCPVGKQGKQGPTVDLFKFPKIIKVHSQEIKKLFLDVFGKLQILQKNSLLKH